MVLQRSIDMMYQGQWRSLQVPVVSPFTSVPDAVAAFHADHDREYAFRRDDTPVELFRLSVTAIGTVPKAELMSHAANGAKAVAESSRMVDFDEVEGAVETPIYSHEGLPAGVTIEGPAIVEQLDSTTVIPPGVRAEVDEWLNIRIHVAEA